jgi:hypothetical protein
LNRIPYEALHRIKGSGAVVKQQQQQPQDPPPRTCTRCGGKLFIETLIMDPDTGRPNFMVRCKACDNHQWTVEK